VWGERGHAAGAHQLEAMNSGVVQQGSEDVTAGKLLTWSTDRQIIKARWSTVGQVSHLV